MLKSIHKTKYTRSQFAIRTFFLECSKLSSNCISNCGSCLSSSWLSLFPRMIHAKVLAISTWMYSLLVDLKMLTRVEIVYSSAIFLWVIGLLTLATPKERSGSEPEHTVKYTGNIKWVFQRHNASAEQGSQNAKGNERDPQCHNVVP